MRKTNFRIVAVGVSVFIGSYLIGLASLSTKSPSQVQAAPQSILAVPHIDPPPSASEAPLLEHPVIAWGVHSLTELYAAINRYRALYEHFDATTAHLVQLDHAITVHSSYRIGDTIFWTRRTIVIQAGTWVWEDAAELLVEARCGNLLVPDQSENPPQTISPPDSPEPTVPAAPSPTVIEPVPPPLETADLIPPIPAEIPPSDFNPGDTPSSPIYPIGLCCGGSGGSNPPTQLSPVVSTPEPNSLALLMLGVVSVGLIQRKSSG